MEFFSYYKLTNRNYKMSISPFTIAQSTPTTASLTQQSLYGGAITMSFTSTYSDISHLRVVPDHQEVWTDSFDNTIILELLNLKTEIDTKDAGTFFFHDLAEASDAASADLLHACPLEDSIFPNISTEIEKCGALGRHLVSKFKDEDKSGTEARNRVMVYVANLRLVEFGTDMLITMYRTVKVGAKSSTTESKEKKKEDDEEEQEYPELKEFVSMLKTLTIVDTGLFG